MNRRRRLSDATDYRTPRTCWPGADRNPQLGLLNHPHLVRSRWRLSDRLPCPVAQTQGSEDIFIVYVSDMGNTATTYTDTGTDLDTRYGYHVKAKNAHSLSDVSNFARTDT